MILGLDLFPERLGLRWEMSMEQCRDVLTKENLRAGASYLVVPVYLDGDLHEIALLYGDDGGLSRIETDIYVSRPFTPDDTTDQMEAVLNEVHERYVHLVQVHTELLGTPTFSGSWGDDDYPEDQIADHLTYWLLPEGRLQIEDSWPDKEFPASVRVATCRTPSAGLLPAKNICWLSVSSTCH